MGNTKLHFAAAQEIYERLRNFTDVEQNEMVAYIADRIVSNRSERMKKLQDEIDQLRKVNNGLAQIINVKTK